MAKCDPAATLAFPYATVSAGRTELADLVALVVEESPLEVIVGLPRSLSGADGPAAVKNRSRAAALAGRLSTLEPPVPVRLVDERLTTVTASRQLREGGRRVKDQRQVIDAASAVTILEYALAAERARGEAAGELVSAPDMPDQPAEGAGGAELQAGDTL